MKQITLSVFWFLFLIALLSSPSLTFADDQQDYLASLTSEELAYYDLNLAPTEEWKEAILEARNSIIYSTSWTVDGQVSYGLPDGTIEKLPEFSELFPDWEVPRLNDSVRTEWLSTQDLYS